MIIHRLVKNRCGLVVLRVWLVDQISSSDMFNSLMHGDFKILLVDCLVNDLYHFYRDNYSRRKKTTINFYDCIGHW